MSTKAKNKDPKAKPINEAEKSAQELGWITDKVPDDDRFVQLDTPTEVIAGYWYVESGSQAVGHWCDSNGDELIEVYGWQEMAKASPKSNVCWDEIRETKKKNE